jgi:hypothetical protein
MSNNRKAAARDLIATCATKLASEREYRALLSNEATALYERSLLYSAYLCRRIEELQRVLEE